MKRTPFLPAPLGGLIFGLFAASTVAHAQEVLPRPTLPFAGKLDPARDKAQPAWPELAKAPKGAPNVVVVLLDDVGFSAASTFGGVAQTPTLQQLANNGISYNQFHVTALCSPTRAALLTGRNHHEVGFGTVADNSSGYPGYNSIWSKDTVSVAEVLRQNGYSTAAFGKWHNTPGWEITPAGPYDHWPTSLGFEQFYGFMGGFDSQYEPRLYRNTTPVEPPATPEQGYHLVADMADQATRWLNTHDAIYPDKPFFLWFAPGGTHWPQHVPKDWIAKYQGKFDQGWDKLREENFARQKKAGVIPANAVLTPRPPELPAWDSLSPDEKKLLARQAEISAAFLAFVDAQVGRVLDNIRAAGQADNTVVFYIVGDNGSALNANLLGNDALDATGKPLSVAERLKNLAELGGPKFDNLFGAAWGWADNTPFQYGKGIPAYLGGTRNPLVVSWPKGITDKGAVRSQFGHAIDLAPTIYEITGVKFPEQVEGVRQTPLSGQSLAVSFTQPNALSRRTLQYFEIGGNRGIYKDGWWAGSRNVANNPNSVWTSAPYGQRDWELYNLNEDFSQANNLAGKNPQKVAELAALFDQEAWRNDVYPLSPIAGVGRPAPATAGRTLFTYRAGVNRIPSRNAPDVIRRAHRITAELEIGSGDNGVIIANGGRFGGYSLFVKDGRLVYEANAHGQRSARIVSSAVLPKGKLKVAFSFEPDAAAPAGQPNAAVAGTGRLYVNDQPVGEGRISKITLSNYDSQDVGSDLGTPVSNDYKVPYAFSGKLNKVEVELR
ncbi:arylsulfatase [Quatrionicoccus australiensis]|uniref:arylsulfatase n=1 Tax=Quatrionicoccus australiensis TaxID=138118 RepID=UPI001CFC10F7|nr:arylsulfatase [Quatrionicoccus australiensis]MCB4358843.1 arylsulfatase [Quatrionicoccus australiensis]